MLACCVMNAFVVSGLVSAEAAFWRGGPSDKARAD
jgi:hypothetical protein